MVDILEGIRSADFENLLQVFFDNNYYYFLFPFLLLFAILYTILGKVSIFRSKKTGRPIKPVIFVISLVVSFYSVNFEISEGYLIGDLLMMMFPNISALTIGILGLYVAGAVAGKDFFRGLFDKKNSAFIYLAVGGIGLGAVLYYVGIAMGFWDIAVIDQTSYWNFILAFFLLILGIVFLFTGLVPIGIVFLFIFFGYVYNSGNATVIEYVIDPIVFIIVIILVLLAWLNSDKDKKFELRESLNRQEKRLQEYEKSYGRKPKDFESRFHDITDSSFNSNKKKWEQNYPGENWK